MSRTAHLHPHLTTEELAERYRTASDLVEARRWQLLWQVAKGATITEAAALVHLNYDYCREIIRTYNAGGPTAIRNRSGERRPPTPFRLLSSEQQQALAHALTERPADGGIWTGPKVARWIAAQIGREHVHAQRGWEYLRRCGHTPHVPRPRHHDADPAAQESFKKKSG
jgi:transposase